VTDRAARQLLEPTGWPLPDPEYYPTGAEIVNDYLIPLANVPEIRPALHLNTRVRHVTRHGFDKMKSKGREDAPFVITVETADGLETQYRAKAVIDASGTYDSPNPLGANGVPALGESRLGQQIYYGIPDVLGTQRPRYANRKVLVVGSGHSAFNTILDLMKLAESAPETKIIWAVRRAKIGQMFGGGEDDNLAARGALGQQVRELVRQGTIQFVTGFRVAELRPLAGQIEVIGESEKIGPVDEIITTTGFRPDLNLLSEMRLDLDPVVESTPVLAPMIDPNLHSCGTVRPHGAEELKHPEPNFYIIGMKSYGRAPTFLLLTGYEQARSVVAAIAGDWAAAREVQLELPETGVCVTNVETESAGLACCGGGASTATPTPVALVNIPINGRAAVAEPAPVAAACCG
jgi:thioredoxin reductase